MFISHQNERIDLRFNSSEICDCITCKIKRLDFLGIEKSLNPKFVKNNIKEQIKIAYANYKLGNLVWAVEILSEALKISRLKQNGIAEFIILFNLSKLNEFLRYDRDTANLSSENLKTLRNAFTQVEKYNLRSIGNSNRLLFNWIGNSNFYNSAFTNLKKHTDALIDANFNASSGSTMMGTTPQDLITEFSKLELFLQSNYIIFDEFTNYRQLSRIFIEGVFASYSTVGKENSRILKLNDWILKIFLEHSKADDLISLFERYNIEELVYEKNEDKNYNSVLDMIIKLIENADQSLVLAEKYCQKHNKFHLIQQEYIQAGLVIAAQIKGDSKSMAKIGGLIPKLGNHPRVRIITKYVEYFLFRRKEYLSKSTLKKTWQTFIKSPSSHWNFSIFESLSDLIYDRFQSIDLSDKEFNENISIAVDYCNICNVNHDSKYFLINLYKITKENNRRQRIRQKIETLLKDNFDTQIYYLSAVYNILPHNEDSYGKIKTECLNTLLGRTERPEDSNVIYYLVNLACKFDLDMSSTFFEEVKGISSFVDWWLDLEGFQYENFDPRWIYSITSCYTFRKMYASNLLKKKLEATMANPNSDLEKFELDRIEATYLYIYIKKTWKDCQ